MDKNRSLSVDTRGQLSLDFLIGISVFLLAFIFVFAFIPGLFVPYTSNSDELTMTADRLAMTLVEDVLALKNSSSVTPCVLDASKIDDLKTAISDPVEYDKIRTSLGLNMSGSALYSLEVIIEEDDGSRIDMINSNEVSETVVGNIGQSKRFVYVRDPAATGIDNYPGHKAILTVRLW